jgi:ZIP family zinc transporter
MDFLSSPNAMTAFMLTLLAGLSTGIGAAIAFFAKRTNTLLLAVALGFSAGVMLYVSFVELLKLSIVDFTLLLGTGAGGWAAVASFFAGMIVIAIIDKVVPEFENPHEAHGVEELDDKEEAKRMRKLYHVGIFTALVLAIHNAPEGLVTFVSAVQDPSLGIAIAIAIAIHNIPEGIAVAIPIFYATGSRAKAFGFALFSGLVEPLGAVLGVVFLSQILGGWMIGFVYAFVAGIMVFISLDELLPSAQKFGHHHASIYGLMIGMAAMAISLLLMA